MKRLAWLFVLVCSGFAQTYNSNILPSTTGYSLGSTSQRWDAYMRNVSISGGLVIDTPGSQPTCSATENRGLIRFYHSTSDVLTQCRRISSGVFAWVSLGVDETTIVHTSGDETISGTKTFSGPISASSVLVGTRVLPDGVVDVRAKGTVDATGSVDSTAAFQAAVDTHQPVIVPVGTYKVCGLKITATTGTIGTLQIFGVQNNTGNELASYASSLYCNSGDMFVVDSGVTSLSTVAVSNLRLITGAAAGHIFNFGSKLVVNLQMHNLYWSQGNPAKSWIVGTGGLQSVHVTNFNGYVAANSTVPAVSVDGPINIVEFGKWTITSWGDAQAPIFSFGGGLVSGSNVSLHDGTCENCAGGIAKLLSIARADFRNLYNYDVSSTVVNPFFEIGTGTSGVVPSAIKFDNVQSTFGTEAKPDVVAPVDAISLQDSALMVSLGGVIADSRTYANSRYPDYVRAAASGAHASGLFVTSDGLSGIGMTGNLLYGANNLSAGWFQAHNGTGVDPTFTRGQSDPLGGNTAVRLEFNAGAGLTVSDLSEVRQNVTAAGGVYTVCAWVKASSGTQPFLLSDGMYWARVFTATADWQRFCNTANNPNGTHQIRVGLVGNITGAVAATSDIVMWGVSFVPGSVIPPLVITDGAPAPIQARAIHKGVALAPAMRGTTTSLGGAALTAGNCSSVTLWLLGTTVGMPVTATPQTYPGDAFYWHAYVSAANTVTVKVCTSLAAGGTPTASLYDVQVFP